jgi:hypothetical protein
VRRTFVFWGLLASLPIAAVLAGIGTLAYWTVPKGPVALQGEPLIAYDPEIGFVPYPNTITRRTDFNPSGQQVVSYRIFNDRLGARVTQPGESAPAHPDILFIGDSFTWGHGVENEYTFAHLVPLALGVTGANISMGSYGTTQSLQMLRRNLDLAPRLVIYGFINDHFARNVLPCARSYYPFCIDTPHVVWEKNGGMRIAPPLSDGTTRTLLQAKMDHAWVDPLTWIVHGVDVAYGRVLLAMGNSTLTDTAMQNRALEFLLGEMAKTTRAIGASLLFVYLPSGGSLPDILVNSASELGVPLLDMSPAYQAYQAAGGPPLTIPGDGHPSIAAHALIASEVASFIRREGLLRQRSGANARLP